MPQPVLHIVGARPNFMKLAPVHAALAASGFRQAILHTGQHYASNMSEVFFTELGVPAPGINLEVGSGSHAVQTARIMEGVERALLDGPRPFVLVYGDVNSTLAAAIVCAKLRIPFAHVEAGLRSRDRSMPEEINRLVTDALADVLFTPSADADENLQAEGIPVDRIVLVGNVMIDTLVRLLPAAGRCWDGTWRDRMTERFGLVTVHRPSNVDEPARLSALVDALAAISRDLPLIFPVHPRTRAAIDTMGVARGAANLHLMEPVGYLDFLALQQHAAVVITDSGGVQEETTYLGVPCLTLRTNTERPITVTMGTNELIGHDLEELVCAAQVATRGAWKQGTIPPLWDGHAADRIAGHLTRLLAD